MLRITVESGGCHGYQYLMSLTEDYDPEEDAYCSLLGIYFLLLSFSPATLCLPSFSTALTLLLPPASAFSQSPFSATLIPVSSKATEQRLSSTQSVSA